MRNLRFAATRRSAMTLRMPESGIRSCPPDSLRLKLRAAEWLAGSSKHILLDDARSRPRAFEAGNFHAHCCRHFFCQWGGFDSARRWPARPLPPVPERVSACGGGGEAAATFGGSLLFFRTRRGPLLAFSPGDAAVAFSPLPATSAMRWPTLTFSPCCTKISEACHPRSTPTPSSPYRSRSLR